MSTGKRINSAVDDAAGLAISTTLGSRVSGIQQAIRNTNDGISVVQIAEGALDEVTTILQRMRDIAVQGANDSLGANERSYLETETEKLQAAITSAVGAAKFGTTSLLDGTFASGKSFQIGAEDGDVLSVSIDTVTLATLNVEDADIEVDTAANASDAIAAIDTALNAVAADRAGLGAVQSQLESTVRNLANVAENTAAAQSRIVDTDYAAETANLTKAQILQQASTAILAQANAQPQAVLALLQ